MSQKTWFLPPNYTFLPEGELSLGTLLSDPSKPTLSLVSLADGSHGYPEIIFPELQSIIETSHNHSHSLPSSLAGKLFTKITGLASAAASLNASDHETTALGTVDLEVRTFGKKINEESLVKITQLDKVKKHIDSGWFGKRAVYIVSGLLVARVVRSHQQSWIDTYSIGQSVGLRDERSSCERWRCFIYQQGKQYVGWVPYRARSGVCA
ncbi:hypothetical protein QBC38DRAFT_464964 [Podospora fimiseda]|uniref:Uncharacterized protein n=1 Tax=Podospora fimiseda TaxID=252190 RepID=A0AAN7BYH9_9PEZI|nr:hypothetical protein QBC38DRAFT_464964 [Podospora fimiseda]